MKLIISKNIVAISSSILLFSFSILLAYLYSYIGKYNTDIQTIVGLTSVLASFFSWIPIVIVLLINIGNENFLQLQLDITIPPKYKLQSEGEFTYIMVKDTLLGNYRQHSVYTDIDKALNAYNRLL